MKVKSFGCSLIFGTDLHDASQGFQLKFSQHTWPALIAQELGLEYRCFAKGGSGNLAIMDRLLCASQNSDDIFIVNWSFIDRFDYSDPRGQHFNSGLNDWCNIIPGTDSDLAKIYYRDIHSEYRDKLTSLMAIYTAISVLTSRRQKFFMTYEDPLMLSDRWHAPPGVVDLQQRVRPYLNDINGQTFIEWSRAQGHAISDTQHPLESAHTAVAKIHKPKIESILHKA